MVWLKRSLGVSLLLLLALAVFWTLSARQREPLAVAANPAAPPIAAPTLVAYPILRRPAPYPSPLAGLPGGYGNVASTHSRAADPPPNFDPRAATTGFYAQRSSGCSWPIKLSTLQSLRRHLPTSPTFRHVSVTSAYTSDTIMVMRRAMLT